MTTVMPLTDDGLRVVMCLAFDHRAPSDDVARFKAMLLKCTSVVSCCDLTGTFDFMIEATLADLDDYKGKLEGMKEALARLVSRYETHFVSKRFVRVPAIESKRAIWVPCCDGRQRVDFASINKVTAEGDYMRVHTSGKSWLLHMTLRRILHDLGDIDFVLVHRSTIVRCGFIDRLLHRGRMWTAKLDDGSTERIAKSRVADVLAKLRTNSSGLRTGWM